MKEPALTLLQTLTDAQLANFVMRLHGWLVADLNQSSEPAPDFTESRAKALLRAANVLDDATLHTFTRLVEAETAVRLTLYDLLNESNLANAPETQAIAAAAHHTTPDASPAPIPWLSLTVAAYAWKSQYPLHQLDPSSPPHEYSPAGQLIKRAAFLLRQQIQRSATERDKLMRQLAYNPGLSTLEQLTPETPIAPLPPHFRPPIPVRYPEVSRETLQITPDETPSAPLTAQRDEPVSLDPDELLPSSPNVTRMPPIRITKDQLRPEQPDRSRAAQVRNRAAAPQANPAMTTNFGNSVRQMFGRGRETMKSTKLRVVVTEYPDGPGIYGLQVKVTCKGVKSFVAGTTNREGHFLCELPVRLQTGLTYDVDVSWPSELGGNVERKSITLHADRTEFMLPFFKRLNQ